MAAFAAPVVLDVSDFGMKPDGGDSTAALQKVLAAAKCAKGGAVVKFPKGRYDFGPNFAPEKYFFPANNNEGLKRVIFNVDGFENITFDGKGSYFVFHGFANPFIVQNSKGVRFENFSVDVFRSYHSEGKILGCGRGWFEVEISEEFPFEIKNGFLRFIGKDDPLLWGRPVDAEYAYQLLLEFDSERRETAYNVGDYYGGCPLKAEKIGGRESAHRTSALYGNCRKHRRISARSSSLSRVHCRQIGGCLVRKSDNPRVGRGWRVRSKYAHGGRCGL